MEHPLDPLSADELRVAVELLRAECELGDDHRIVSVTLDEPPKADVLAFDPQRPTERDAFAVTYDPVAGRVQEAVLSLTSRKVRSRREVPGAQPPVILSEVEEGIAAVKADPAFRAALAARGVKDLDLLHVELWPFGDLAPEEDRHL